MTLDTTKPVQLRDGRKARIICTDRPGNYPIVALIGDNQNPERFMANGQFGLNPGSDLINSEPEMTGGEETATSKALGKPTSNTSKR